MPFNPNLPNKLKSVAAAVVAGVGVFTGQLTEAQAKNLLLL